MENEGIVTLTSFFANIFWRQILILEPRVTFIPNPTVALLFSSYTYSYLFDKPNLFTCWTISMLICPCYSDTPISSVVRRVKQNSRASMDACTQHHTFPHCIFFHGPLINAVWNDSEKKKQHTRNNSAFKRLPTCLPVADIAYLALPVRMSIHFVFSLQ